MESNFLVNFEVASSNSFRDIKKKLSWCRRRRRTSTIALSENAFEFRLKNQQDKRGWLTIHCVGVIWPHSGRLPYWNNFRKLKLAISRKQLGRFLRKCKRGRPDVATSNFSELGVRMGSGNFLNSRKNVGRPLGTYSSVHAKFSSKEVFDLKRNSLNSRIYITNVVARRLFRCGGLDGVSDEA